MVVGDAMGLRGPEGMCSPNRAKNRLFLRATSSLETEVNSSALCHISMRVCVCVSGRGCPPLSRSPGPPLPGAQQEPHNCPLSSSSRPVQGTGPGKGKSGRQGLTSAAPRPWPATWGTVVLLSV